jgi:N-acetylneuraminic acid mutarotase
VNNQWSTLACVLALSSFVSGAEAQKLEIQDCPVAVASFGAAVCDGHLYLYGGNEGTAHSFSLEGQNNVFRRIKLETGSEWESLGEVPRRQGNALVTYEGKIYRVGGFEALNTADAEQDMVSSSDFQSYDPATGEWTALSELPEPRSSFDAVVVGNMLYAVGGWSLLGKDIETKWLETAWKIDLSDSSAKWQAIAKPPFTTRANSVGHANGKIYVIGGMAQRGGPTTDVAVYDPENDSWSDGPALPGDAMQGFGNSGFNVGGKLIVSTANGQIVCLDEVGKEWVQLHQMDSGRFFHRLVAIDDHSFAVLCGVSGDGAKQNGVLVFDLNEFEAANDE